MQLAMYKGPPTEFWHKVGHEGTCLWTFSEYSHCELVFGGPGKGGRHLCASSSARDGGVRFKHIDLSSGRWDVYPIEGDEAAAYDWFVAHQGAPYDSLGLVWFVLPIDQFNQPASYFCSEAVASALGYAKPHKFHPQRVLDTALRTTHELRP